MNKKNLTVLSVILIITAILLMIFNIGVFKDWKKEKISVREAHKFVCDLKEINSERELTNNYIYEITTDKDYLVTEANYTEEIQYNNPSDYEDAKHYYSDNYGDKKFTYDDKKNTIYLTSKLEVESNASFPTPPFEMYKDTFIPKDYKCKEVLK